MPFRQYTQFNPDALRIMSAAYDTVIAKLGIPTSDPLTSQIATKIVTLARLSSIMELSPANIDTVIDGHIV